MSNRRPKAASKHARIPKTQAQRIKQPVVRSSKDYPVRSVAAGSTEAPPKRHDDSKQQAPVVESQAVALQGNLGRMMKDNDSRRGFDFSLATANVQVYQMILLEMAQANMQFAFEFAQRLATIRSPFEMLAVISEFTNRRIDMLWMHSKEMAELSTRRLTV